MTTEIKYEPKTLADYIFPNKKVEDIVGMYVSGYAKKPLILHGPVGTGKSLLASLIPKAIDGPMVQVDKVYTDDLKTRTDVNKKLVRPETFDHLFEVGQQSQNYTIFDECVIDEKVHRDAVLNAMDAMRGRGLIIFTTNKFNNFMEAVVSRSTELHVSALSPQMFLPRAKYILNAEGVEIPDNALLNALSATQAIRQDNRLYYGALDEIIYKANHR